MEGGHGPRAVDELGESRPFRGNPQRLVNSTHATKKAGKQGKETRGGNKARKQGKETRGGNKARKQGKKTRGGNKAKVRWWEGLETTARGFARVRPDDFSGLGSLTTLGSTRTRCSTRARARQSGDRPIDDPPLLWSDPHRRPAPNP